MSNEETKCKFKATDRVRRKDGTGAFGTIKEIRSETVSVGSQNKDRPVLVQVQWDNGTLSYMAPMALESSDSQ